MTDQGRVLVTGPTGTVGEPLLRMLIDSGRQVAAGARDPARLGSIPQSSGLQHRVLDFERPETFDPAVSGIGQVFLMRPPAISDTKRYLRPFIRAAERSGVQHVVFLSVMGVNRAMPHWQVEQDLKSSTMAWTLLRPSFFAQNLQTAYRGDIRDRSRLRLPAGNGRTSFIDTRDVAAVAAAVLNDPERHAGHAYTLTGPVALNYHTVASMLSAELGRPITYESPGLLTYRRELRQQELPAAYINVQLLINVVARLGLAAKVTDTVRQLLGRPPTDLAGYLHDHRGMWAGPGC